MIITLIYPYLFQHLGDSAAALTQLADGSHPFSKTLKAAKNPMIVVGSGALQRADGAAIHAAVSSLAQAVRASSQAPQDWKVLNVLQRVSVFSRCSTVLPDRTTVEVLWSSGQVADCRSQGTQFESWPLL